MHDGMSDVPLADALVGPRPRPARQDRLPALTDRQTDAQAACFPPFEIGKTPISFLRPIHIFKTPKLLFWPGLDSATVESM